MKNITAYPILLSLLLLNLPSSAGEFKLEALTAGTLRSTEAAQPPASAPGTAALFRRVEIGSFRSRGLYASGGEGLRPAILLLPGSGPNGPEGMVPGKYTLDGKPAPLLLQAALPFISAGFHTLALGVPGADFWPDGAGSPPSYAVELQKTELWKAMLKNAAEGLGFLRAQPGVDPEQVWILGHSEGTQVAADIAAAEAAAGLVLLGYTGEDLVTSYRWQLSDRNLDAFIRPDVDADKDGFVSRAEAAAWPKNFGWPWAEGQEKVSIEEIAAVLRKQAEAAVAVMKADPGCRDGHCERGPSYAAAASFPGPVYAFTGELDLQTRPREALALKAECDRRGKANCLVEIIPGVQHAFSPPKPPGHPLVNVTLGPIGQDLLSRLGNLAAKIASRQK